MVRPNKKKLEEMNEQDKELSKLPSLNDEKKVFKKGESILKHLIKVKKVRLNLKKFQGLKKKSFLKKKKFKKRV